MRLHQEDVFLILETDMNKEAEPTQEIPQQQDLDRVFYEIVGGLTARYIRVEHTEHAIERQPRITDWSQFADTHEQNIIRGNE